MSITYLSLMLALAVVNIYYIFYFTKDILRHRLALCKERGNKFALALSSAVIFLLSSFGISDFATSTVVYKKSKMISDELLPGTLNTQCVIPVAVMAISFISVVKISFLTLFVCIIAQAIGAYIGPRFVMGLSASVIRLFIAAALFIAALFILAGKLHWMPSGGTATSLSGVKLLLAAVCLFVFGALNNIGIGSYPLTMVTVYALGLNPVLAFPIMMGASAISVPIGGVEFIKRGGYARKITLFASIFGTLGAVFGICFLTGLNVSHLQWLVMVVLFYSAGDMYWEEWKKRQATAR